MRYLTSLRDSKDGREEKQLHIKACVKYHLIRDVCHAIHEIVEKDDGL